MSKTVKKIRGLSLHIIPYSEIRELSITERIKKILHLVLNNKVLIIQGRLRPEEEIRLIEDTMAMVDHIKSFKGIELAVIEPDMGNESFFMKVRKGLAKTLVGHHNALTIVGPASIVKEIRKDPKKLEVLLG
ncbi:MAG: DUF2073 domain-containing protein [Nanoarchaeota archaeon]